MTKARISSQLARKWRANPSAQVHAIVKASEKNDENAFALERRGLTIRKRFGLLPAYAVTGPAEACLALANEDWVASVEEDQHVHTM